VSVSYYWYRVMSLRAIETRLDLPNTTPPAGGGQLSRGGWGVGGGLSRGGLLPLSSAAKTSGCPGGNGCGRERRVLAPPATTPVRKRAHERLCAFLFLSLQQLHMHQRTPAFLNR
jgi:hypothetical protein